MMALSPSNEKYLLIKNKNQFKEKSFCIKKMENIQQLEVQYPIRSQTDKKKWTPEFRREWNKEYRLRVKNGEHTPMKRTDSSKWKDKTFRAAYDKARHNVMSEKRFETMTAFEPPPSSKNYTQKEKDTILKQMIEKIQNGEEYDHPYFKLSLAVKPEFKRKKTSSKNSDDSCV